MANPYDSIELRHLVALSAIAQTGSFSRAAEQLGYTQSAVSQQIARLERHLGQRLVERRGGPRAIALTAAGQVLVRHADAVVARLASARADLRALASGTAGTLRVGCYQSVGARLLPRILREFVATWPQVEVELHEHEDDAELLAMVEHGELDLTFVALPMMPGPFAHRELLEDPYVAVVPRESPLGADGRAVPTSALEGIPLVTYGRMRDVHAIEHRLGRPALAAQILFRSNDNGTIIGLVAEGVGTAVVSWLSVDPARDDVRTVLIDGIPPRIVGIAWHRDRYHLPAAESFIRVAQQVAYAVQGAAPVQ
ncbi:LysR family transcriptional regulator [Leekyejoonella antrihumi]|uniref:LysR family transcriptional regulator n=1 Tax=Leekyejoonella antrihumi TaxID=1660198 RepID=A0A563DZX4_9MICO|nr:LysR family transcriptional regulator [Leekyejoonella antrihumi]TWP35807.1 LysR family transcriptional regulator [Leekyejoonella antrihumi]